MKTICQAGTLLMIFVITCTTAMAQNTDKQTGSNSPSKKSTMQVIFIDRFVVPAAARAEFLERAKMNRNFIKDLPGFIEDTAYEEAGDGESHFVTVAVWQDAESIQNAKKAVTEEYQKEGFNPPEFMKKLNIKLERGLYKRLQN